MAKFLMVVLSNTLPGKDEEYNQWYDETHIPDLLTVPGIKSAQRFTLADRGFPGWAIPGHKYMAIYEVEAEDSTTFINEFAEARRDMHVSPAIDRNNSAGWLFVPLMERQYADGRDLP